MPIDDKEAGADADVVVEVAYATPKRQLIIATEVPPGATVAQAVRLSGICEEFPEIDLEANRLGVFGRVVRPDALLRPGDRVEIYRPLMVDPRQARRQRAARAKASHQQQDTDAERSR